ncbi:hypothetical protein Anas_12495 [Armadillidium nasatum]|uniref:Innexin n=1 Tax=Armadillidium nasatum TaxID=96803 RepID=A0A5N5T5P4_9CRUS|nr:hypothetical protein Anas_12495 [Armadillidium nasatum]
MFHRYGWYNSEEIHCIRDFNANEAVKSHEKNMCLSYSYLENEKIGIKMHILYYRWVPYVFLVMSMVYYLPRLGTGNHEEIVSKITCYFKHNVGSHKIIYGLFLCNHFLSCFIVCASIYFLNFVLQGHFFFLSFYSLLNKRDPENFDDPLSIIFPPFVTCMVGRNTQMANMRDEFFNCHFVLMEFYEKVFIFVWMYLII